jgi:hypothetical protein
VVSSAYTANPQNVEEVRASVAGAFEPGGKGPGGQVERDPDSDDDRGHFKLGKAGGGVDSPMGAGEAPGCSSS